MTITTEKWIGSFFGFPPSPNGPSHMDLLDWLSSFFGFQADNVRNQWEHLVLHLANAQMRLSPPPDNIDSLDPAVLRRFRRKLLCNFSNWCSFLGRKPNIWISGSSRDDGKKGSVHVATPHPSKPAGKTPANKLNQQTPKSEGSHSCKSCNRPANAQGGLRAESGKFTAGIGHNRRALSSINRNIVEAAPYPHAVSKRGGLSEKQVIPYKNQLIPVHRPMTRKLATQMSYHYDGSSGSKPEFIFATSDEGVEKSTQVPSAMQEEASRSYDCILKSASQKNPNVSEDVPHITRCTRTMQNPSLIDSPSFSHRTPRSLSAETVGFFKQLADLIQRNKFNELKTLPPQVQLDQQTIQNYEQVLKNYLSGHLLDLAEESKYQEFSKVLTALLACRRIPPSLHQGFLSLCWELPTLASRASELHKQVTRGLLFHIARSKEKEQPTKYGNHQVF